MRPALPQRTASRASTARPISRQSRRGATTHRFAAPLSTLVESFTCFSPEDPEYRTISANVVKTFEQTSGGASSNQYEVRGRLEGLEEKARIRVQDELADAICLANTRLADLRTPSSLSLAAVPTESTLIYASQMLLAQEQPVVADETVTWKKIIEEEPLEGEHWQDAFDTYGSDNSDSDAASFAIDHTEDQSPGASSVTERASEPVQAGTDARLENTHFNIRSRETIENLRRRQYWTDQWTIDSEVGKEFDVNVPSTLGPSFQRMASRHYKDIVGPHADRYICDVDAHRETFFALQNRTNIFFEALDVVKIRTTYPRLLHVTADTQASILESFLVPLNILAHLRAFARDTSQKPVTRVHEACAAAIEQELRVFDAWCSELETELIAPTEVVTISFIALERRVSARTEALAPILTALYIAQKDPVRLLDALFEAVQERLTLDSNPEAVERIFEAAVVPMWDAVHRWLRDGMRFDSENGDDLQHVLFLRREHTDSSVSTYWQSGYSVGTERVPKFFGGKLAYDVLSAGKAVGLLRAMGLSPPDMDEWYAMEAVVDNSTTVTSLPGRRRRSDARCVAIRVEKHLQPHFHPPQALLKNVLESECQLWMHLQAMEDLYTMRQGDAMAHFCDILFAKMESYPKWYDFHVLNTTFRDAAAIGPPAWIDPLLVQFSYRPASLTASRTRSVRALSGLQVHYTLPFPLSYIPRDQYSKVFVFLLQIRRAKSTIDRVLLRVLPRSNGAQLFYVMRSRLLWFINTLYAFLTLHVIHTQQTSLRAELQNAPSLDAILGIHASHLSKIEARCFLGESTAALHRAILSILDIALHFNDCLTTFTGDAVTRDVSQASQILAEHFGKRRRRRRRRAGRRRDVVGFSDSLRGGESSDTSSSEDDLDPEATRWADSSTVDASALTLDDHQGVVERIEKLSSELDNLMRFVHRNVETLSIHASEASATFRALSFALADWET